MKKKRVYWKVCIKNRKGQFVSCTITGKLALVYQIGKWIKPIVGKCFVFGSERSARSFAGLGVYAIFPCEVKNPKRLGWCSLQWPAIKRIRAFWQGTTYRHQQMITPTGTVGVDAVKILPDPERRKP